MGPSKMIMTLSCYIFYFKENDTIVYLDTNITVNRNVIKDVSETIFQ